MSSSERLSVSGSHRYIVINLFTHKQTQTVEQYELIHQMKGETENSPNHTEDSVESNYAGHRQRSFQIQIRIGGEKGEHVVDAGHQARCERSRSVRRNTQSI